VEGLFALTRVLLPTPLPAPLTFMSRPVRNIPKRLRTLVLDIISTSVNLLLLRRRQVLVAVGLIWVLLAF
jgi:hypothetical protein